MLYSVYDSAQCVTEQLVLATAVYEELETVSVLCDTTQQTALRVLAAAVATVAVMMKATVATVVLVTKSACGGTLLLHITGQPTMTTYKLPTLQCRWFRL
jgi:hypothetical protein